MVAQNHYRDTQKTIDMEAGEQDNIYICTYVDI